MKISIAVIGDESLYNKIKDMPFPHKIYISEDIALALKMHDGRSDYHVVIRSGKITKNFYKDLVTALESMPEKSLVSLCLDKSITRTSGVYISKKLLVDNAIAIPTKDIYKALDRGLKGKPFDKIKSYYRDNFDVVYYFDIVKGV